MPATDKRRILTAAFSRHFPLLLSIAFSLIFSATQGALHGWRTVRQVNVTSGGQAMGNGNMTGMSAANAMWKNTDGTVGANGSSLGTAGGPGNSNMMSRANAVVGGTDALSAGYSLANGTETRSSGQSASNVNSNGQMSVQNTAEGSAIGTGNSQVRAAGGGVLMNGSQISPYSGQNTYGEAGATGSQMSASQVSLGQTLGWFNIVATLRAISTSKGENNSQANVGLRGGTKGNSIAIDGLVSGVNDNGGGSSLSLVEGSGTLNNGTSSLSAGLLGAVNASSGGTKLVGASSLSSNTTNNNRTMNSFGDLRLNGTGQSQGGLVSNTSVNSDGTVRGIAGIQGMSNGGNKTISVNDGLQTNDGKGGPQAVIGQGNIQGVGNVAANGSSYVLSQYQTGQGASLTVGSQGDSKAVNGTPSDLRISNTGNFLNGSQITNASSMAQGRVTGDQSSVSGQSTMDLGKTQNGNSSVTATGTGKGSASALTDASLNLAGPGGSAGSQTVRGNVDAKGDQAYVMSSSNLSNQNGLQSLFNTQNATVQGKGSSQAQASNYAILKRRRRRRQAGATPNVRKLGEIVQKWMQK